MVVGPRSCCCEVGDGLTDAAEAYSSVGLGPGRPRARAVADFGDLGAGRRRLRRARGRAGRGRPAAVVLGPGYVLVLRAWLIGSACDPSRSAPGRPRLLDGLFTGSASVAVIGGGCWSCSHSAFGARRGRLTCALDPLVGAAGWLRRNDPRHLLRRLAVDLRLTPAGSRCGTGRTFSASPSA